MKYLLISLGHNASAVFYESNSKKIIGYEQERFDKVKASSAYPIDCINEIMKHVDITKCNIGISNWFNDQHLKNKYLNEDHLLSLLNKYNCNLLPHKDHHDLHAMSSINFSHEHSGPKEGKAMVIDGFGNDYKSISIYKYSGYRLQPEFTYRGYTYSLGLLYQYATAFLGMKENQDEYKLLGYQSHVTEDEASVIDNYIHKYSSEYFSGILKNNEKKIDKHSLIDYSLLGEVRNRVYQMCQDVVNNKHFLKSDPKIVIAHFVQSLVEQIVTSLCTYFGLYEDHLCLSGGVFYNVKLNNLISRKAKSISIVPVCGDQGAALGYVDGLKLGDLCIGKRQEAKVDERFDVAELAEAIYNGKILNLVHSNMEFGPRALCNTSTICMPKQSIIDDINKANGRNSVMPCAPVMLEENASYFFRTRSLNKVVGSNKFMIITHDYRGTIKLEDYDGVMHKYPLENVYSGRPQLVERTSPIGMILRYLDDKYGVKCLVNTSFNVHGVPIVFNYGDAKLNNNYQAKTLNNLIFYYANSI